LPEHPKHPLSTLARGHKAYVQGIRTNGLLRRRLVDLGFIPGAAVESIFSGPSGDPIVYRVKDSQIALREADAELVEIADAAPAPPRDEPSGAPMSCARSGACRRCPSRALHSAGNGSKANGDGGSDANDAKALTIALAGNPNTGKTTVFNALTGLRQHVGNWPGKTVTRSEGSWAFQGRRFRVVDLPGTYSLLSASTDEEIARDYILFGAPDCTVVVADATSLERNLNLVLQVLEITDRAVLCVNLIDQARQWGVEVDAAALQHELGVPVVLTAARQDEGLDELKQAVLQVAAGARRCRPRRIPYAPDLQAAVDELLPRLQKAFPDLPNTRWIAMRLIDGGDARLREELSHGLLADLAGRIGSGSLRDGVHPDRGKGEA
jgi:ferrous iron transport protein B